MSASRRDRSDGNDPIPMGAIPAGRCGSSDLFQRAGGGHARVDPKAGSSSPCCPLSHSWLTKPARLLGVCKFPVLKASLSFVCPADGSCWFAHSGFKFTVMLRIDCFSAAQSKQCQIPSLLQPFAAVKVEHSGASGVCLWSQGTSYRAWVDLLETSEAASAEMRS